MSIIIPANSAVSGGFDVANSCMFNSPDSASFSKTPSGAGSNTVWTVSMWVKRASLAAGKIHAAGTSSTYEFLFDDSGFGLTLYNGAATVFVTSRALRDVSAWYHIVLAYNTGASGTDKCKLFINGVQETSFSTDNRSSAGTMNHINQAVVQYVGRTHGGGYFDGYMAEVCIIDGTQYAASDFGKFDEDSGIWKPIDVSGLTFGTNGFYLDFEDSANLGNDANGGTDLTENNLAATDQGTDTCTNNFVTLNRLDTHASATLSQGNTGIATTASGWYGGSGTMGITLGQSLYFEAKAISTARLYFGLSRIGQGVRGTALNNAAEGDANFDYMWRTTSANSVWYGGSDQSITIAATSANDICACRVNTDGQVIFYKNDAVVVTYSTTLVAGYTYFPILSVNAYGGGTESWLGNFGNPSYAITSSNTDPDGYGDFEFSTKSAYALNTKNLAEYG